jgi:predicted Zn-dependent peptidase
MNAARTLTAGAAVLALCAMPLVQASGQMPGGQPPAGQASPSKGVILKGKAPVSNEILKVKLPRPNESDLPNGIHLMVIEDHRAPQVSVQMTIQGAGGLFDPADAPGLASFTAAMMIEGTAARTSQQIAQELEAMASTVSVSTGANSEVAVLMASSLTDNLDKTLDLAADVLLNPSFPDAELARYKTRQKAQLVQVRSMPQFLAAERYGRVMYGDHPAGRVMPTADAIDKATREALAGFHRARYAPDQAIVAIVGDITPAEARAKIESRFGAWKKTGAAVAPVADPAPLGPGRICLVDRANSVQTSLIVGTQGINRTNPDYDVMSLLNAIIGGGPTGRLFLNLREEKGWTYGAYSGLSAPRYRGDWSAQTEIKGDVTDKAVAEIVNEVKRTRTEPIPDKEFMDKKRSLVASFALSLETPSAILNNYVTSRRYNLPADYWDKYPERMMAITREQVQAAAQKYLDPARLQIVAVGDGAKIGEGLKSFGTVEAYDPDGKRKRP